jgi:hypothetical protein
MKTRNQVNSMHSADAGVTQGTNPAVDNDPLASLGLSPLQIAIVRTLRRFSRTSVRATTAAQIASVLAGVHGQCGFSVTENRVEKELRAIVQRHPGLANTAAGFWFAAICAERASAPGAPLLGCVTPDIERALGEQSLVPDCRRCGKPGGTFFSIQFNLRQMAKLRAVAECLGWSLRDFIGISIYVLEEQITQMIGLSPFQLDKLPHRQRAQIAQRFEATARAVRSSAKG